MVIAHNMLAMNAQRQYGITTSDRKKSTEKLSSGYKINRAADDAAGLTISEKMRSQIRGLNQGSDNIQDGISVVQIADGALAEVNDMLHRITELSVKSANGTNTAEDRAAIQKEVQQLISEIDRIHESTEFNTMPLFDGDTTKEGGPVASIGPVKCESTKAGYMVENYHDHPAAKLDFSGINATNIGDLAGKYFDFRCVAGCGETFKFTFVDGTGSKLKSDSTALHNFEIDISGKTTGAELVAEIYNTVVDAKTNNQIHYNGTPSSSLTYGVPVGHANGLDTDGGNTLIVYGHGSDPDIFKTLQDGNKGKINTKQIVGPTTELGKMKPFWIHCSSNPNDGIQIEIEKMNAEYIGIDTIDVSTQSGAKTAIDMVKNATSMVSGMRSDLGAYQNRLEHAYANNENKAENTQAAESRIRDTDMATEMMKNTKESILMQANEAMMAQANQSTQSVLSLLQ